MTNTIARIKRGGKHFEVLVNMDNALKFRKGESDFIEAEGDRVFTDSKKGEVPSSNDLKDAFGTTNVGEIVKKIVKEGEVQTTQAHRDAEQEKKFKQIVEFLSRNAVDPQSGNPITTERIKNALEQSNVNIKNTSVENQISDILAEISKIIPIKIQTKRIRIKVPAAQTGQIYGIIAQHKENENWLDDGSLEVVVKIPAGMAMDFYDKLNNITHGSAITEEIKE